MSSFDVANAEHSLISKPKVYDGCYVKLDNDPAFWLVEDGERLKINSPEEMYAHGLRPVAVLSPSELTKIPVKGSRKARKSKEVDE